MRIDPGNPRYFRGQRHGDLVLTCMRFSRPADHDPRRVLLMATLFGLYPFLLKLYADGGYQGHIPRKGCVAL